MTELTEPAMVEAVERPDLNTAQIVPFPSQQPDLFVSQDDRVAIIAACRRGLDDLKRAESSLKEILARPAVDDKEADLVAEKAMEAPIERFGQMVAALVDETLMTVHDSDSSTEKRELRLGSFRPDLFNRAAELLEEFGMW